MGDESVLEEDGMGAADEAGAAAAAAAADNELDDCDLWRRDSSAGLFRRRSWLFVAKWPGVWLRWMFGTGIAAVGGAVVLALEVLAVLPERFLSRSRSSRRRRLLVLMCWLSSKLETSSSVGEASCWIFWDRITLDRWGERGVWRPASAMAGHRAHWPGPRG